MERASPSSPPPDAGGGSAALLRFLGPALGILWLLIALPDRASWRFGWLAFFALVLGGALAWPKGAERVAGVLLVPRATAYVALVAGTAFVMSLAFVLGPMEAKPVSIDANVYLFEARMLSQGGFGAEVHPPRIASSARFLFEGPDGRLYGVFPPGYPFFLAPFVRLGLPLFAGPVTAVLLVLAQNALGRAVLRAGAFGPEDGPLARETELGHRLGLLLPLFAFQRTLHTADLLSHAFVAALAAFALAGALDLARGRGSMRDVASIGVLLGWIFVARMLDGVLAGAVVGAVLVVGVFRRKLSPARLALVALCAVPFLALLAAQQKAATGSPTVATQTEYFVRSDWPPTCHRIGFGDDVGCSVEHPDAPEKIGTDGYHLDDAWRVIQERGSALGQDLFGLGALGALAFFLLWRRPHPALGAVAAMVLAFVLGYGLFYFGNVQWYGGRHVLPSAPFFYVLMGHALVLLPRGGGGGAGREAATRLSRVLPAAAALGMLFAGQPAWNKNSKEIQERQRGRSDVRRSIARHKVEKGIFRSSDGPALVAAIDPERYGARIHLVADDKSGLLDVRRHYPELPLVLSLENDEIGTALGLPPPPPGILVELERTWPTFTRPSGLAAAARETAEVAPGGSGGKALFVTHAAPGATLTAPFDVAKTDRYRLRLDAFTGPSHGRYTIAIDGRAIGVHDGYDPEVRFRRGVELEPIELTAGRHELTFRCEGKAEESQGFDATLDALVGLSP